MFERSYAVERQSGTTMAELRGTQPSAAPSRYSHFRKNMSLLGKWYFVSRAINIKGSQ